MSKRLKTLGSGGENQHTKEEDEGNTGKGTDKSEPLKDYIHVRARRGQATDSHSLAERARREKISDRMKTLQDLVPGCNKELMSVFGEYGTITSSVVMKDAQGNSKCFGFVNFERSDDAAKAVEALNGQKFDDKELYVGRAQKKAEREAELKLRYDQRLKEVADKYKGTNLYIKNLDDSVDDEKLKELFSPFGSIASCKVM